MARTSSVQKNNRAEQIEAAQRVERQLLASAVHDFPYAVENGFEEIQEDWFSTDQHRIVYRGIIDCARTGEDVDVVGVGMRLKGLSPVDFTTMLDTVPSGASFPLLRKRLHSIWQQRKLAAAVAVARERLDAFSETAYEDAKAKIEEAFREADSGTTDYLATPLRWVIDDTLPQIRPAEERSVEGAISTGLEPLDEILGNGFAPKTYAILAARPSMGKTALATKIIHSMGLMYETVLFFSLEMSASEIAKNLLALHSGVNSWAIRRGNYRDGAYEDVLEAAGELSELPVEIVEKADMSVAEIASAVKRRQYKGTVGLVVIDYLQLIRHGRGDSRDERVAAISKQLKQAAKETGVPFLVLAQVNREVDNPKRKDKRPSLSDLRESGAIEQDADVVMFLYRDGYYDKEIKRKEAQTGHTKTELIVAKQRTGPVGTILLDFNLRSGNFTPWEEEEEDDLPHVPDSPVVSAAMVGNRAAEAFAQRED